jgi:hypothetical protein
MTWFYFLFFAVWLFGFPYLMLGLRKAPSRLQAWADRHRLKIIERREPWLAWSGPFFARTTVQVVYRVVFEDEKGQRRSAWVLCGGPVRGSWVDQVDVRWDNREDSTLQFGHESETQVGRRLFVAMRHRLVLRGVLLGPCFGICIALVMLQLTGLMPSKVVVPMLVISIIFGAVVGALLGMAGGAFTLWMAQNIKDKSVIDEL